MTNTATIRVRTVSVPAPYNHQLSAVTKASNSTTGTNTPATRSAILATGALPDWASSTMRMILARVDSSPIRLIRRVSIPLMQRVPPVTSSPVEQDLGTLSPVSIDSSTSETPSSTRPSAGRVSPGRTRIRSPG